MARARATWAWDDTGRRPDDARHHHRQRHRAVGDDVWPGESLLYLLRERLGLPGAKNACEQGECGSCTVYLDGEPVCACLVAAGQATAARSPPSRGWPPGGAAPGAGGLRRGRRRPVRLLHPGLVVAAHDLLARVPCPSDPEIREGRCG
jgi:carbon-monoxide dehydrogenase small subunit